MNHVNRIQSRDPILSSQYGVQRIYTNILELCVLTVWCTKDIHKHTGIVCPHSMVYKGYTQTYWNCVSPQYGIQRIYTNILELCVLTVWCTKDIHKHTGIVCPHSMVYKGYTQTQWNCVSPQYGVQRIYTNIVELCVPTVWCTRDIHKHTGIVCPHSMVYKGYTQTYWNCVSPQYGVQRIYTNILELCVPTVWYTKDIHKHTGIVCPHSMVYKGYTQTYWNCVSSQYGVQRIYTNIVELCVLTVWCTKDIYKHSGIMCAHSMVYKGYTQTYWNCVSPQYGVQRIYTNILELCVPTVWCTKDIHKHTGIVCAHSMVYKRSTNILELDYLK